MIPIPPHSISQSPAILYRMHERSKDIRDLENFEVYIPGYTRTLLEELIEDILGIVEFHEVSRTFLE